MPLTLPRVPASCATVLSSGPQIYAHGCHPPCPLGSVTPHSYAPGSFPHQRPDVLLSSLRLIGSTLRRHDIFLVLPAGPPLPATPTTSPQQPRGLPSACCPTRMFVTSLSIRFHNPFRDFHSLQAPFYLQVPGQPHKSPPLCPHVPAGLLSFAPPACLPVLCPHAHCSKRTASYTSQGSVSQRH